MIKYISILPITIYLFYIWYNYGIQKSISESYYKLTKKEKPWFFISLVSTSLLLIGIFAHDNLEEHPLQVIFLFFACLGIGYTSAAARFKQDKLTNTWHMSGAIGGFILGYAFIVIRHGWDSLWFIIPSVLLVYMIYDVEEKLRFIHESDCYTSAYKYSLIWWAEIIGTLAIYAATL